VEKFLERYFGDVHSSVQWHRFFLWVLVGLLIDRSDRLYGESLVASVGQMRVGAFLGKDGLIGLVSVADFAVAAGLVSVSILVLRWLASRFTALIWAKIGVKERVESLMRSTVGSPLSPGEWAEVVQKELRARIRSVWRLHAVTEMTFASSVAIGVLSRTHEDLLFCSVLLIVAVLSFCAALLQYLRRVLPWKIHLALVSGTSIDVLDLGD
jgi:hypothetical protein